MALIFLVTFSVFDPSIDDLPEYKTVHYDYKEVVQSLLDAFMKDTKLSNDQGLFELVLAMEDYAIFVTMMTQKNIELQQQALMLILKQQGALPDSLMEGSVTTPPPAPRPQDNEEEIMRKVLEQSKREYEEEQQKRIKRQTTKDKDEMASTIAISKHEFLQLEKNKKSEQEKLNQAMVGLSLQGTSEGPTTKAMAPLIPVPTPAPAKPQVEKKQQPVIGTPGVKQTQPTVTVTTPGGATGTMPIGAGTSDGTSGLSQTVLGQGLLPLTSVPSKVSSSEAAANWLKSAQTESSGGDQAVQKAAAAMAGMSADEIKKRQEYLRQQRDKLIAMKKAEREKQLLTAEQSNPERPASARASRQTLKGDKQEEKIPVISEEEQKKIEMRRQIANKLKAELMGSSN
ncbi:CFA36-like protein [Mya arenaria]|uniref:CFA36-like protein n=1 Tax=Mya arenaria TaxID=6604 RepID=A0ABY7FNN5_MYAAR|nr:CFA36-like protein [Mya arenaria]